MAHPIVLSSLSPREAVTDALYRALAGLDLNDRELWDSAWVEGSAARFEMNDTVYDGKDTLDDNIFKPIGPLATHHNISNVRVDLRDGADTAYMTAYAIAQHYRAGEGLNPTTKHLISGAMYFMELVKNSSDGLWKMKKWVMKLIWLDGDGSIVGM